MLVPIGWTLWGIILLVMLYGLVRVMTERNTSPEAGPGLGVMLFLVLLALHGGPQRGTTSYAIARYGES